MYLKLATAGTLVAVFTVTQQPFDRLRAAPSFVEGQQPPARPPGSQLQLPPTTQRPPAQAQPTVPVAATAIVAAPDKFVGSSVSLTAAVDQTFGATAFSIVQGKTNAAKSELLVLAPVLTAPVKNGVYVTVIGEVVRFDAAAVAAKMKDAMPSLAADVVERYRGRPAIVAVSVINNAMTDLAKRLPPPMSPQEEAFSKLMKQIGPGFNALRQASTALNAVDTGAQAALLKTLFAESSAFWKAKAHPDALQWADDARKLAETIEAASGKGNLDEVKTSIPKLQQVCGSCHNQYRERLDDGTYRYKQPSK